MVKDTANNNLGTRSALLLWRAGLVYEAPSTQHALLFVSWEAKIIAFQPVLSTHTHSWNLSQVLSKSYHLFFT